MIKSMMAFATFATLMVTGVFFQAPSYAKEGPNETKIQEQYKSTKSSLPSIIRALKRDKVYSPKMRALIKEAIAFDKSFAGQTKMTKAIRKKINAKAIELANKYPKEIMILNKYISLN